MSDEELDREWKPSGRRPQSTMARSFSAALNDLFKIDNSLADLDAAVEEKKRAVSSQTSELEALEARLKATEARLKQRQSMGFYGSSSRIVPGRGRPSLGGDTFIPQSKPEERERNIPAPLNTELRPKTATRPPTGKRDPSFTHPPLPGALPPTPGASEGSDGSESESTESEEEEQKTPADYVVVNKRGDFPPPVPPKHASRRPSS